MCKSGVRPTGGELLARSLKAAGVSHVFALHGGHLEAFYRGCLNHGIELVDFRHEAVRGFMPLMAYARCDRQARCLRHIPRTRLCQLPCPRS